MNAFLNNNNNYTGSNYDETIIKEIPFDKYIIEVALDSKFLFKGITGIKVNKNFTGGEMNHQSAVTLNSLLYDGLGN